MDGMEEPSPPSAPPPPPPPLRSAEASRVSSCLFADRVATLALAAFRARCPPALLDSYRQTVVAAFLIRNEAAATHADMRMPLEVVSFGVGTKFLPWEILNEESASSPRTRCRLTDCHAEVLARRGLLRFLLAHCAAALRDTDTGTDTGTGTTDTGTGNETCAGDTDTHPTSATSAAAAAAAPSRVLRVLPDGQCALREGVEIHFYSSSQPCGNASIKKWAKGKKPQVYGSLPPTSYPEETHDRLHVTARAEGQVALLHKRSIRESTPAPAPAAADTTASIITTTATTGASSESVYPPPGTAALSSRCGRIMTCSDKIAKWNALGLQVRPCRAVMCYAMLCYAVLCYAMLCYAMLCYAVLCYHMLCYAVLCYAVLCCAMLCCAMLCYAMLCYAMLCCARCAMLCYAVLCYAMLCYDVLCYAMLCCAMLSYAMLSYAML
jgi:hypothetical protein